MEFMYKGELRTAADLKKELLPSKEYEDYLAEKEQLQNEIDNLENCMEETRSEICELESQLHDLTREWEAEERRLGLV